MVLSVKNRSALLDKNLHVVPEETTKDFFTYFDFHCDYIVDFVHPDEQQRFIDLVTGKDNKDDNRSDVFHLFRNTGRYCYNFVTVRNVKGEYAARIRLFDIYDAIEFARVAAEENGKIRALLGMTDEYLFSYRRSDHLFTVVHYTHDHETTAYEMQFSDWKKQVIAEGMVADGEIAKLETLEDELTAKVPPASFMVKINTSLRTGGKVTEHLRILGGFHEGHEEQYMLGRILSDESYKQIHHAHTLLGELQIDPLTEVYNKKTITTYAEQKLKAKLPDSFALVIVDLDHFKPVNDMYGHLAGDNVLARAAARIKEIVGEDGVVGRFGGDEFMLLLDDIDNVQILRGMLRAVLVQIRKEFAGNFEGIDITCSLGAAVYPTNGTTYDELFRKADFCLYRAKEKGRNRYVFFRDDLHAQAYADSLAAKSEGKKTEGREVQELKYMAGYMQQLSVDPATAVLNAMRHMLGTYALDCITLYAGSDMKRVLHVGVRRPEFAEARYVFSEDFTQALCDNSYVLINFVGQMENAGASFVAEMQRRRIQSSIQCLIGTPDAIRGLVSFDRIHTPAMWADYELNCARLFTASLQLIDLGVFEK